MQAAALIMATGSLAATAVLFIIISSSLLVCGRAQTVSVIRIAPQQYEAVEGQHDEAIVTSVLKNDVNETGYVYTRTFLLLILFLSSSAGHCWKCVAILVLQTMRWRMQQVILRDC